MLQRRMQQSDVVRHSHDIRQRSSAVNITNILALSSDNIHALLRVFIKFFML
jgi:hypothetical protein